LTIECGWIGLRCEGNQADQCCMFVESLREMESHRVQKNYEKGGYSEACKSDSANAGSVPISDKDIHSQEDKYVAVEEKPCTFKGTFSDSEDEPDTKFVH